MPSANTTIMINDCEKVIKNLGLSKCNTMPGLLRGMIETPFDFKVEDEADLTDITFWNNAALADPSVRIYLWPKFRTFENASSEPVYEETPLDDLAVLDGKYRFRFGIKENLCLHKAMFTHNSSNRRLIFYDHKNNFIGAENTTGAFMGLLASLVNVENLLFNDGSVSSKTPLYVVLDDSNEFNEHGVMFKANFINEIHRIIDVVMKQVSSTATVLTVDVNAQCDGTPIVGLLTPDFMATEADGTVIVVTASPIASFPGRYALTATAWTAGDKVTLRAPSVLTIKPYEQITPLVVTIP